MLGWHITIYRQAAGEETPAAFEAPTCNELAVWQTGIGGLDWIDELVDKGLAICLASNGYPTEYTARLEHVRATILEGPPCANDIWRFGPSDVLTDKWLGKTTIYDALSECSPDEWVVIQAWDES
jgi:hypothetical protein